MEEQAYQKVSNKVYLANVDSTEAEFEVPY